MKRLLFVLLTILPGVLLSQVKTDAELTTDANVIRNETVTGGNTKTRIANMFQSIINSKVSLSGTYTNPDWLVSIPWTKITATPTTLSTFGITDGVPSSRTLTINGTAYDLSANRSWTITSTTTWGSITGTLSSQTDLQTAIDGKVADAINNGTTTIAPSQNAVFDALALKSERTREYGIACSDLTTALTTGTIKGYFDIPRGFTVTGVFASVLTAQSSGSILTIDINEAGTSILSTKLTIDNNETNSSTAATPAVISDTSIAQYARLTIDIDQVGSSPVGLIVWIIGY
jgi:hypothetical protein